MDKSFLFRRKDVNFATIIQTTINMELRSIFQSVIALHQEELPLNLKDRAQTLPVDKESIVTVTGIRRC